MTKVNWNSVIDTLQAALVWFVIGVIAVCVTVLILFDVFAGTGVQWHLTSKNITASILISLATTGLLLALMFMGYSLLRTQFKSVGWGLFVVALGVYLIDTYFDALGADILRYGTIVGAEQLDDIHILYRILIGGISTVGEPLATAIIVGMPVMKEIINNAIPVSQRYTPSTQPYSTKNYSVPSSLPRNIPRPVQQSQPNEYPTYHPIGLQPMKRKDGER